jgi:nuclear transport factor 2 (NTF2) superfamily protein
MSRPPLPPFTQETAAQKARGAEDGWNTRDPARVALAYSENSRWRNRAEFLEGRPAIEAFLTRKWNRELDYRLIKELWAFHENRTSVSEAEASALHIRFDTAHMRVTRPHCTNRRCIETRICRSCTR